MAKISFHVSSQLIRCFCTWLWQTGSCRGWLGKLLLCVLVGFCNYGLFVFCTLWYLKFWNLSLEDIGKQVFRGGCKSRYLSFATNPPEQTLINQRCWTNHLPFPSAICIIFLLDLSACAAKDFLYCLRLRRKLYVLSFLHCVHCKTAVRRLLHNVCGGDGDDIGSDGEEPVMVKR